MELGLEGSNVDTTTRKGKERKRAAEQAGRNIYIYIMCMEVYRVYIPNIFFFVTKDGLVCVGWVEWSGCKREVRVYGSTSIITWRWSWSTSVEIPWVLSLLLLAPLRERSKTVRELGGGVATSPTEISGGGAG
jgi:hypothetical protein